jgi:hypothetical protein
MMACPNVRPPARLSLSEAHGIVTNPQRGAATHPLLRMDAWAVLKADHIARQRRARLMLAPHDPNSPKDAA